MPIVVLITIGEWSFKIGHGPSEGIVPMSGASGSSLLDTLLGLLVAQPRRTPAAIGPPRRLSDCDLDGGGKAM